MSEHLKDLVCRARQGEQAAYGELYEHFERSVYGLCHALLDNPADAADATQEAFVNVWERLPGLRHPEAFSAFLRGAAVQACRSRRRRSRWLSFWSELGGAHDGAPEPVDEAPLVEADLVRRELAAEVRRGLARLSPEHREVVVLHYFEGLPLGEIAATLGVAVGTVKSRLGRAREHLERLLRPVLEDEQ